MSRMRRGTRWRSVIRAAAVLGAATVYAASGGPGAPLAGAVSQETISGSGSTWSYNAVQQWIADVQPQGTLVNFNRNGSGQGRQDFANSFVDFANSDIRYQDKDPLTGQPDASNRAYAYIPIIAGGTALMYHLNVGGKLFDGVRLSGATVAKIFTGVITNWSDPQITEDMNGHALPDKRIQVIVDAQGGGTTAQFTDWMVHQHGDIWGPYAGKNESTSYYPIKGDNMSGTPGDDRISAAIASPNGDGAIGFVQYSYALNLHYPVAKVLNAAGYYTLPTQYNAAVALQNADIEMANHDPKYYLTQKLDRVYTNPDPRTYLLSSYSYMIIPTADNDPRINYGKALSFSNFSYYGLCEGQRKAFQQGYSPLPLNLVQAAFDQVPHFSHMLPEFRQQKDATTCNNPTFDKDHPERNRLAVIDPPPAECNRHGQGPCGMAPAAGGPGGNTGGAGGGPGSNTGNNGSGGNGGNGGGGSDPGAGGADANAPSGADPSTAADAAASGPAGSSATELAAFRQGGMTTVLGVLAGIELVLVLLVPAFVSRAVARDRTRRDDGS